MIDQEKLNDMLNRALPEVVESFKQELKQTVSWQMRDEAAKVIKEHVVTWVKENVLPDLTDWLVTNKQGLLSTAQAASPKIMEALAESMFAALKENLEKSWDRKKIFEAMFD